MKYRDALKHLAIAVPLSPFDRAIWRAIRENAGMLFFDLSNIVFRLIAVALYPLVVPILAAALVKGVRAHEQAIQKALRAEGFE